MACWKAAWQDLVPTLARLKKRALGGHVSSEDCACSCLACTCVPGRSVINEFIHGNASTTTSRQCMAKSDFDWSRYWSCSQCSRLEASNSLARHCKIHVYYWVAQITTICTIRARQDIFATWWKHCELYGKISMALSAGAGKHTTRIRCWIGSLSW